MHQFPDLRQFAAHRSSYFNDGVWRFNINLPDRGIRADLLVETGDSDSGILDVLRSLSFELRPGVARLPGGPNGSVDLPGGRRGSRSCYCNGRDWLLGQDLLQDRATSSAGDGGNASRNASSADPEQDLDRIDRSDRILSQIRRLPALLDRRNGSGVVSALLCIGEEARPAVEANGLHGIRDFLGGFPQVGVGSGQPDVEGGAVQHLGYRVCCPSKEAVSELALG